MINCIRTYQRTPEHDYDTDSTDDCVIYHETFYNSEMGVVQGYPKVVNLQRLLDTSRGVKRAQGTHTTACISNEYLKALFLPGVTKIDKPFGNFFRFHKQI